MTTLRKEIIVSIFLFITSNILFAQSYQLRPGTYYLLDDRINVRSEPRLSGMILGQLNVNTRVNVLQCEFNEQIIDGFPAYWYKIEYNNTFGYIWGGYIANQTLIYDIDNNGVNDYFHYRASRIWAEAHNSFSEIVDMNKDVFIYINNNLIYNKFEVARRDDRPYLYCTIFLGKDIWVNEYMSRVENVIFQFYANPWVYFFEVDQYGEIQLIHVWAK